MIIPGYTLAFMMGLTLGLVGAGGSILAVPILVYCFSIKPTLATAYSLLIVGTTASLGALNYGFKQQICFKSALIFAIPAMITSWLTRALLLPTIPNQILSISKDNLIMLCFSLIMITAAVFMLKYKLKLSDPKIEPSLLQRILSSSLIGLVTGFVGAGGGFLIMPTLMTLFHLQIKQAIATSLLVITLNAFIGFSGDLFTGISLDWSLLSIFLAMTLSGIIAGSTAAKFVDGSKLRSIFAIFTLILGSILLCNQIFQILSCS